mmetsp:Transcript_3894/g.8607  ORF Transcript_3894/g.8607 Transcript_3894/m.8607 type:complete len:299 (-) Transcript_3894:2121-3017(-)
MTEKFLSHQHRPHTAVHDVARVVMFCCYRFQLDKLLICHVCTCPRIRKVQRTKKIFHGLPLSISNKLQQSSNGAASLHIVVNLDESPIHCDVTLVLFFLHSFAYRRQRSRSPLPTRFLRTSRKSRPISSWYALAASRSWLIRKTSSSSFSDGLMSEHSVETSANLRLRRFDSAQRPGDSAHSPYLFFAPGVNTSHRSGPLQYSRATKGILPRKPTCPKPFRSTSTAAAWVASEMPHTLGWDRSGCSVLHTRISRIMACWAFAFACSPPTTSSTLLKVLRKISGGLEAESGSSRRVSRR